ncbi:MAG: FecR family protein [Candidatus Sericytochromatia bacterium]
MKKILILSLVTSLGFISPSFALEKRGSIDKVINMVQIDHNNSRNWSKAEKNESVFVGDNIRTGLRSVAQINYDDGTSTRIGSRSFITVNDRKIKIKRGYMWGKVDKNKTKGLKLFTSNAVASILGTEFFIEKSGNTTSLVVLEGEIEFKSLKGNVKVTEGTFSTIDDKGIITDPIPFDKDTVLKRYAELLID